MSLLQRIRGSNAIEFALVMPLLALLLGGLVDYGWYFWREALVTNALREAVRSGSLKRPDPNTEGPGACLACVNAAQSVAITGLAAQGVTGVPVTATLERMPALGAPCTYAVVLQPTIPHSRVFPVLPGPITFQVRVVSMAQNVTCP